MEERSPQTDLWAQLQIPLIVLGSFVLLLWAIEIVDQLIFHGALDSFGVRPRTLLGLWGILWAPFLHGGFRHLLANTGPILILGSIVMLSRPLKEFFTISFIVIIIGGLGTWLIGPRFSVHLGASGLIFGYFGFLLLSAYFERSCRATVIALVVLLLYSGIIWGVLPQSGSISWQTHLFGFVGGGVAAYLLSHKRDGHVTVTVLDEY
ncbi:MAG: rhomboid family intramembrane serine protease [Ardenticatenaceae bacterium]|nr:rhomboid family intramembrane serine protease [Anaerolineales bacterium]MCB9009341.1 rhomboid family intramembrane serine protease [Ardenticatenaceae bacterium]